MSEMVERVARSIATADWRNEIDQYREPARWDRAEDAYDLTNNNGRFQYDQIARAAIEAMRNYTDAMYEAGEEVGGYDVTHVTWEAMIDAALKD